jgi:hypothetical protein
MAWISRTWSLEEHVKPSEVLSQVLEKAKAYAPGTIRTWKGKHFQKTEKGWRPVKKDGGAQQQVHSLSPKQETAVARIRQHNEDYFVKKVTPSFAIVEFSERGDTYRIEKNGEYSKTATTKGGNVQSVPKSSNTSTRKGYAGRTTGGWERTYGKKSSR